MHGETLIDSVLERFSEAIHPGVMPALKAALIRVIAEQRKQDCLYLQSVLSEITATYSGHAQALLLSDQIRGTIERQLYPLKIN